MPDTPGTENSGIPATYVFDSVAFDARCRELGATTEVARADLTKVDRSTLMRYRRGLTFPLLNDAYDFAASVGMAVTDLWKES
jgi:hypothetical protein